MPLHKMEKYLHEARTMSIMPDELLCIGGGEAMAPYMHNDPTYIPRALDMIYSYNFIPTIKTNGTWGDDQEMRKLILSDIAKCAYKSGKLVTLDISVDEFHHNISGVTKIIYNTLQSKELFFAIRICLVGFNTKKSAFALAKLKQDLQKRGLKIDSTVIGDWMIERPDGEGIYMINDFSAGIFNLGRAKDNQIYTDTGNPTGSIDCLQIDNNDIAIYNYTSQEPINNRPLNEVLYSLMINNLRNR
jgi:hypothetical protein